MEKNKSKEAQSTGLKVGSIINGKYKIVAHIGKGGMSEVWLALNEKVNKQWAIKEIRKTSRNNQRIVRQNLLTETEILTKLRHPHLPSIVDIINNDDTCLIIMDYIEGRTMKDIIDENGAQSQENVIDWMLQLCSVLNYLHTREPSIIYRDVKPGNIMLKPTGGIVLIDFGTAREFNPEKNEDTTCLGTKGYAAPEQYGGNGQTDERTDIYNLGATMYHLITGKNPTKPPYEMRPIREWDPSLSSGLETIILKCIANNPDERYQNIKEVRYALKHYKELEHTYIKKKKAKKRLFLIGLALFLATFTSGVGTRIYAENLKAELYKEKIRLTQISENKTETIHAYKEAIKINPSNEKPYLEWLNNICLKDGILSQDETGEIIKILGFKEKDDKKTIEENFKTSNIEGYERFAYNMGLAYFYYYDGTGNKKLSQPWFEIAKNSKKLPKNQIDRAKRFYEISNYYAQINNIDKAGDSKISYKDYWDELVTMSSGDIEREDNTRTALVIYRELANQIAVNANKFKTSGITKTALITEIERINKKTEGIAISKNRDEIDEKLIKETKTNIEIATKILETVY